MLALLKSAQMLKGQRVMMTLYGCTSISYFLKQLKAYSFLCIFAIGYFLLVCVVLCLCFFNRHDYWYWQQKA